MVLLFVYASVSKVFDFENFQVQIAQSPVMSAYASFVSYAVIIVELLIAGLLVFDRTRLIGHYFSLGLMTAFTVYIYVILNFSEFIPCSCGGILEKLGWTEHLIFNMLCVALTGASIIIQEKYKGSSSTAYIAKISLTMILSILLVVLAYKSSEYIIRKENNFTRKFLPHSVDFPKKIDLGTNSFYFAGSENDTIFLGNVTAPLIMGTIDGRFESLKLDTLSIDRTDLAFNSTRLNVDYPFYSIFDGKVPAIFQGRFPGKSARLIMKDKFFFSQIIMTDPSHYIFRTHHRIKNENIVGNIALDRSDNNVKFNFNFLEKQIDGRFDTDGKLIRDSRKKEVIYTYFYRNEYRRIDKDLAFLGNGRTIDSTSKAQIEIAKTKTGEMKMVKPPLKVNLLQYAFDGLLFNISNLKGRHESDNIWKKSSIIDVYDYRNNSYLYSFPIDHHNGEKVRDMLVTEKYLYVLIGNDIIKYKRMYKPRH